MWVWFESKETSVAVPAENHTRPTICLKDFHLMLKSDFSPSEHAQLIDIFIPLVKKDIQALRASGECMGFQQCNMTSDELRAIDELVHNHDFTIKPVDKGGGVMVMDMVKYIAEANRQLADQDVYRPLSGDPREKNQGCH